MFEMSPHLAHIDRTSVRALCQHSLMPPRRGELGYGDFCTALIEQGRCACEGCSGTLTDPARSPTGWAFCRLCCCAHKVGVDRWHARGRPPNRYAAWIPDYDRCRAAARKMAEDAREQERQERRRRLAEELGDPQR